MKINKIAGILKKDKRIILYDAPDEKTQWIGDGSCAFPLFGLPYLEEESIFTMFDITEKQREKFHFQHTTLPEGINFTDTDVAENMIDGESLSVAAAGRVLKALQTQKGIVFINTKYLEPLGDEMEIAELYERFTPSGQIYIAVKAGFMLMGVIFPYDLITKEFVGQLEDLLAQCRIALESKEQERAARDSDQTAIDYE